MADADHWLEDACLVGPAGAGVADVRAVVLFVFGALLVNQALLNASIGKTNRKH